MSRDRGLVLQRALAAYLRQWWPSAESTPNGRPGSDVLGTPGIVWECKTPRRFDPFAWVVQARAHADTSHPLEDSGGYGPELPVVVYWPDGVGARRPELCLAILPLPELVGLLVEAGYGTEVTVE